MVTSLLSSLVNYQVHLCVQSQTGQRKQRICPDHRVRPANSNVPTSHKSQKARATSPHRMRGWVGCSCHFVVLEQHYLMLVSLVGWLVVYLRALSPPPPLRFV